MRYAKLAAIFLAVYLLQVVVISRFALIGVRPDLLLIAVSMYSISFGAEEGFIAGVICGLIQDLFSGFFFVHTLSKGLLGFLIGTLKESVLGTDEAVVLSAVMTATVTNFIFEYILLFFFFGRPLSTFPVLLITLILSCVYNSILAFLLAPSMRLISRAALAE
jgi:rod shape-determining protein MreD